MINSSPLSMGLLTHCGPPPWHPSSQIIKETIATAVNYCAVCNSISIIARYIEKREKNSKEVMMKNIRIVILPMRFNVRRSISKWNDSLSIIPFDFPDVLRASYPLILSHGLACLFTVNQSIIAAISEPLKISICRCDQSSILPLETHL